MQMKWKPDSGTLIRSSSKRHLSTAARLQRRQPRFESLLTSLAKLAALVVVSCAALAFAGTEARAQIVPQDFDGFALNRYTPAEQGSDWFFNDSLDLRGSGRLAAGLIGDFALRPLVIYDEDGNALADVVDQQLYIHAGLAVNLWDRVRIAGNLPILVINSGEPGVFNGQQLEPARTLGLGDAHLSADVRLFGEYGGPATVAIGAQVLLPTGQQGNLSGDGSLRIRPRLLVAGDLGPIAYALGGSYTLRPQETRTNFAGEPFGDELGLSGALGVRLVDKRLLLGGEIWGTSTIDGLFERRTTAFEVVFGGKFRLADAWQIGLAVGPGITRGVGSPQLRGLFSLTWFPRPEVPVVAPVDTDGDGIADIDDACPDVAGVSNTEDSTKHGCPAEDDRDGDGILDEDDACPDEAGVESSDLTLHGCPEPEDRDGDGILDDDDACPDEAGVENDDEQYHGCPDPDPDNDGVLAPDDACPDKAGVADTDPEKNGCPKAKIVQGKIEILERVEFATNESTIEPESYPVLESVLRILEEYKGIELVSIEGHTDNRGRRSYNQRLSQSRAESVMQWLVDRGIDASRLEAKGYGPDTPIETNQTEEGRRNNRRVEFQITRGGPGDSVEVTTE